MQAQYLAELVGTMMLVFMGNGVVANAVLNKTNASQSKDNWIVITAGWGFALMIAVYLTGWVSGAHLNPAVSLAMFVMGKISMNVMIGYAMAQLLGAMIGAFLVYLVYLNHFNATDNTGAILGSFSSSPNIKCPLINLITEMMGAAVLVIGILAITSPYNAVDKGLAPLLIGLLLWGIGLSIGGPTGFAVNPARDLGPRLMHAILPIKNKGSSGWLYSWVPVVGPLLGGFVGALVFKTLEAIWKTTLVG
jgi:glycerol uptake facilitator protein